MRRITDLSEPWKCPPSLERVFAKRHAIQALRRAKAAERVKKTTRKVAVYEPTNTEFFATYRAWVERRNG
jgi:hypothetical protein